MTRHECLRRWHRITRVAGSLARAASCRGAAWARLSAIAGLVFAAGTWAGSSQTSELRAQSATAAREIRLEEYLQAAVAHEPGRADEHLRLVARLGYLQIDRLVSDLQALRQAWSSSQTRKDEPWGQEVALLKAGNWQGNVEDAGGLLRVDSAEEQVADTTWIVKQCAVLHTDVLVVGREESSGPDVWSESYAGSLHLRTARKLVDTVWREGTDPEFVRSWYLSIASYLNATHEVLTQPVFLDEARAILPDEPELLMAAGAVHELLASGRAEAVGMPANRRELSPRERLLLARNALSEALRLAPDLAEARIRLGRVLGELGRRKEARQTLSEVDPGLVGWRLGFVCHLLRGQQDEALGDDAAAAASYLAALDLAPAARSALLALSCLSRRAGRQAEALDCLDRMLAGTGNLAGESDPWEDYYTASLGRRAEVLLAAMRARAAGRRPSETSAGLDTPPALPVPRSGSHATIAPQRMSVTGAGVTEEGQAVFSSKVEAVHVDVLVTRGGRVVSGLTGDDFEVFDNGVRQEAKLIDAGSLPLDLVFVLDASASMAGERMAALKKAAGTLLDQLDARDRAAVLAFQDRVTPVSDLTRDVNAVRGSLDNLQAAGATALNDALYSGIVLAESGAGRKLVVTFTDGADTASYLAESALLDAAGRTDAVVYVVSSAQPAGRLLSRVAGQTGGRLLRLRADDSFSSAFVQILDEFRRRYLLSYSPAGAERGGWHRIDVKVRGRGLSVTARPGYHDAGHAEKPGVKGAPGFDSKKGAG